MPYSVLIDTVRCIGCQGCQVACKSWNSMPGERTTLGKTLGNPARLDSSTYTLIGFTELDRPNGVSWQFTKKQCMHCLQPACVSACPVGALTKSPDGPVVYHKGLCIGCRYCMLSCPFEIPKFEWDKSFPYIRKCTFCSERLAAGLQPACTKTCPSGALIFGSREKIIETAKARMNHRPGMYNPEVYGMEQAGGTAWLYISGVEYKELGLREDLSRRPYGEYTWDALSKTPAAGIGAAAVLAGLSLIIGRRAALSGKDKQEGSD
jgi:formate dehydrogenase iron-sulfur subunit